MDFLDNIYPYLKVVEVGQGDLSCLQRVYF